MSLKEQLNRIATQARRDQETAAVRAREEWTTAIYDAIMQTCEDAAKRGFFGKKARISTSSLKSMKVNREIPLFTTMQELIAVAVKRLEENGLSACITNVDEQDFTVTVTVEWN